MSRGSARRILVPVAVAALAAWALVAIGPGWLYGPVEVLTDYLDDGPGMLAAVVYIAIGAIPATLLHELGHALAALARPDTPVGVAVGSFGKLAEVRLGQSTLSGSAARDILWIALAGPLASLAGLAASVAVLGVAPASGVAHDLAWAAVFGNGVGVLNLIPLRLQERPDGARMHTDGRLALDAARTLRALR